MDGQKFTKLLSLFSSLLIISGGSRTEESSVALIFRAGEAV